MVEEGAGVAATLWRWLDSRLVGLETLQETVLARSEAGPAPAEASSLVGSGEAAASTSEAERRSASAHEAAELEELVPRSGPRVTGPPGYGCGSGGECTVRVLPPPPDAAGAGATDVLYRVAWRSSLAHPCVPLAHRGVPPPGLTRVPLLFPRSYSRTAGTARRRFADFEWLRRQLLLHNDGACTPWARARGPCSPPCPLHPPCLTRSPLPPGVVVPPLPERTMAETAAAAALAAGGAGTLVSAAASAALAAAAPPAVGAAVARAAALERFLARCCVHALLRASPPLVVFLETEEEEAWAKVAPWRERDGLALTDALSSVASFFATRTAAAAGGMDSLSGAAPGTPSSVAAALFGAPPPQQQTQTHLAPLGGGGAGDGALRESKRYSETVAYVSRLEDGLAAFTDALRALADAQSAASAPLTLLSQRAAAAAKAEARGGRAMHGGGHGSTALPAPPWPAFADTCDKLAVPSDGMGWAMESAVLPPLADAAALVGAVKDVIALRAEVLASHAAAMQQLAAAEGALRAARVGAAGGGGGASSSAQQQTLTEELRQLWLVRDGLAQRHALFVERFEGREVPHFRRQLAGLLRAALRALVCTQAAASGHAARAASAFAFPLPHSGSRQSLVGLGSPTRALDRRNSTASATSTGASPPSTPSLARHASDPLLFRSASSNALAMPPCATPLHRPPLGGEAAAQHQLATVGSPPGGGGAPEASSHTAVAAAAIAAATAAAAASSAANQAAAAFFQSSGRAAAPAREAGAESPPSQRLLPTGDVYFGASASAGATGGLQRTPSSRAGPALSDTPRRLSFEAQVPPRSPSSARTRETAQAAAAVDERAMKGRRALFMEPLGGKKKASSAA